jgi:hypothetical protein
MRLLASMLLLAASLPVAGGSNRPPDCRDRCDQDYNLCLKRSTSKKAKKTCNVMRKTCKHLCPGR